VQEERKAAKLEAEYSRDHAPYQVLSGWAVVQTLQDGLVIKGHPCTKNVTQTGTVDLRERHRESR
jgi:hypothetical protein